MDIFYSFLFIVIIFSLTGGFVTFDIYKDHNYCENKGYEKPTEYRDASKLIKCCSYGIEDGELIESCEWFDRR